MTLTYLFQAPAGHEDDPAPRPVRASRDVALEREVSTLSDEERALVARVRTGDASALEQIFRTYYPELLHFAATCARGSDSPDDIVHDVFAAIIRRESTWDVTTSLRAYLFRAVRNRALTIRRHASREDARITRMRDTDDETLRLGAESADVPAISDNSEDLDPARLARLTAAIEQALSALSPALRNIVALRWEHGLSYADIADVLGTTDVAARKQASRALALLRTTVRRLIA